MKSDDIRGPLFKLVIAIVTVILLGVVINLFLNEGLWEYIKENAEAKWTQVTNKTKENTPEEIKSQENTVVEEKETNNGVIEINVQDYQNNATISVYE